MQWNFPYSNFGVGGRRGGYWFFGVPNVFPSSSKWVPSMFTKFPMCSTTCFQQNCTLSHMLCPIFSSWNLYMWAKFWDLIHFYVWSGYFYNVVVSKGFKIYLVTGQSKMAHLHPKKKLNLEGTQLMNTDQRVYAKTKSEKSLLLISQFAMPQFSRVKNLLALVKWIRKIDQGNFLNFQHPRLVPC